MITGKIIKSDNDTVTLGFPEGSFSIVSRADLGFYATDGDIVELYKSQVDGTEVTIYAKQDLQSKISDYARQFQIDRGENEVNQVTYVLLAILVGNFGVHKFYAGKTFLGVIYLLFFWTAIPAVVGLVEGIIAATKKADVNGMIKV